MDYFLGGLGFRGLRKVTLSLHCGAFFGLTNSVCRILKGSPSRNYNGKIHKARSYTSLSRNLGIRMLKFEAVWSSCVGAYEGEVV